VSSAPRVDTRVGDPAVRQRAMDSLDSGLAPGGVALCYATRVVDLQRHLHTVYATVEWANTTEPVTHVSKESIKAFFVDRFRDGNYTYRR
jgi:hypothetical protein